MDTNLNQPQQPQAVPAQPVQSPPTYTQLNYLSLTGASKPSSMPVFWGLLVLGLVLGIGLVVLGVAAIDIGQDSIAAGLITFGLVLTVAPSQIFAANHRSKHMERFARDNGLEFYRNVETDDYRGVLTDLSRTRVIVAQPLFVSNSGVFAQLGNLVFKIKDRVQLDIEGDETETQYAWGYVSVVLPRSVPRIFLDSRKNSGPFALDRLPFSIDKSQKLSMEDGFDDIFSLYAPMDYAHDAYYIFRREILGVLMSAAGAYDIELSGDRLYVYRMKPLDFMKPAEIEEMIGIAQLLKTAFYESTSRYKDSYKEVLSSDQLATQGQSLQVK